MSDNKINRNKLGLLIDNYNWKLLREGDNLTKFSKDILFIEFECN